MTVGVTFIPAPRIISPTHVQYPHPPLGEPLSPVSPNLTRVSETRRKPRSLSHLHPEHFLKSQFEPAKNKNPISDKREKRKEAPSTRLHLPFSISHFPWLPQYAHTPEKSPSTSPPCGTTPSLPTTYNAN
jgi:hypothetical protein